MIEIICRGKSPSEAKAKRMVTEILLTEKNGVNRHSNQSIKCYRWYIHSRNGG